MTLKKSERICAFCPNAAESGEHLWSAWMGSLLRATSYQFRDGKRSKVFQKKSLNQKVTVVCRKCNSGWMSDLENKHAKPAMADIIHKGRDTFLTVREIVSISTFAFKHAVVADHADFDREPFFAAEARHSFRASLTIPPGVQMWIGRFGSRKGIFRGLYHGVDSSPVGGFKFYAFTYVAGFLALQVVAKVGIGEHKEHIELGTIVQHRAWNSFAIPLWPSDGHAIHWPPPRDLNNKIIDQFANRFKDVDLVFT
jgi:hypothetical protein